MSPTNKETADLIRRVSNIGKIPAQAAMPQGGFTGGYGVYQPTKPYDPTQLTKATQEGQDLAASVAQGGLTLFGGIVRVVSGLGRGMTNLAAGVLPHANNIWDTYKDGFQWGDIATTANEALQAQTDGTWGFIKGVAVSGVPAAEEAIKQIDNRPIYEWGTDLLTSKEFHRSMQNLKQSPILGNSPLGYLIDGLDKLNDPTFAEERNPLTFGLLNNAETYGLGWDILTDPTTYVTMGIAGALKGGLRGASSVIKYSKAGKAANFADVASNAKWLPRPYYGVSRATKKIPLANPTYTVANTSPLTYIAKEMGRGFTEAHRARLIHITSRTAALQAVNEYNKNFAGGMLGKTDATPQYVEELATVTKERVLDQRRTQLVQQGITDPMQVETFVAETAKILDEHAAEIAQKAPEWIKALSSKEAAANIERIAAENGVTPLEISAMEIANSTARGLKSTRLAIPKTKDPKFNTDAAFSFSRSLETLSDPKYTDANFGELWGGLVKSGASEATIRKVFEAMVLPIGYRERWAEAGAKTAAEELSAAQDLIRAQYGLGLNPSARRSRKIAADIKTKKERIPGTKIERVRYEKRDSKELRQLMKMLRIAKDTRQGAGSKLTASKKKNILTKDQIELAPTEFLANLAKNYYEDVIRKEIPGARPWDELLWVDKEPVIGKILSDPTLITPEIFQKSITSPTLAAARVQYLVERSLSTQTPDFTLITRLKDDLYNPATIQSKHPQMHSLVFDAIDKKAGQKITLSEVLKLSNIAAGRIYDRELNKILFKLGVNRASLHTPNGMIDASKLEEILHEAHTALIANKRAAFLLKLKNQNKGEFGAEALVDPVELNADVKAMLEQHITDLQRKGIVTTEDDVKTALEKLGDLQTEQINARKKLLSMGFDPDGVGMPAFDAVTKIDSPRTVKATSTESKMFNQLKRIIAKPSAEITNPIEALNRVKVALEEFATQKNLSDGMKRGIEEILNGSVNLNKAVLSKGMTNQELGAYFSVIGNIVKRIENETMSGTTIGYDAVFSRRAGEYDTVAIQSFLEEAFRASKSQDSLDGGYFAEQLELMHKRAAGRTSSFKPLSEQTPEELTRSLSKIGPWNGEGISAPLLQTMIRFTEKHVGRTKTIELSDWEKADIARSEDSIIQMLSAELITREKRIFEVESARSTITMEDFGSGRGMGLSKEVIAKLSDEEKAIYQEVMDEAHTITVDINGEVQKLIKEFIGEIFKAKSVIQNLTFNGEGAWWDKVKKLNPNDKGFYQKVEDVVASLTPGTSISYEPFRKLFSAIDNSFGPRSVLKKQVPAELVRVKQISYQIGVLGWTKQQKRATQAIEAYRARKAAMDYYPKFASATRMENAAAKIGNKSKAGVNWRARAWLATLIVKGDSGIRELEKNNPLLSKLEKITDATKKTQLDKEKEQFGTLVKKLIEKYAKEGYRSSGTDLAEKSIGEIIQSKNPIDFLRKIGTMKVTNPEEEAAWDTAMQHLLNLPLTGKGNKYSSFAELVKTYKTAGRTLKPGEINPETGKQVPTEQEVLQTLLSFESTLSDRARLLLEQPTVKRETVLTLLRRLDKSLQKAELEDARSGDFMDRVHSAASNQINDVAATLPEPRVMQQELLNQLALERVKMYDEGFPQIDLLVAGVTGKQQKQFIIDRFKLVEDAQNQLLGKTESKVLDFGKEKVKWSYETTSIGLTGWSELIRTLSSMAKSKGFTMGSSERMQFMTEMTMRVLRLKDLHLQVSGIFPATTWSAKRGEGAILKLGYTPEEIKVLGRPAYLTEADVLDIFPQDMIANMLFVGPSKSVPITSFIAPAHLLVNAMDLLKPGTYFSEEQLRVLSSKMAELMRNDMKHSFIDGSNEISHYAMNIDAFEQNIRTIVAYMIDPANATKLFEQHVLNGAFALKAYQYKSGIVSKPILEALGKMFENPFAKSGNKVDAILQASEDLRKLTGREDLSEEVKFQAELDLNTLISAYMDRDSFSLAQEALRIEAAQQSAEGRAILAAQQKAARGNTQQRINQIRLQLDEERNDLFVNLAGLRNLNEVINIPAIERDAPFDVFNEHLTAEVNIGLTLRFVEKFGRTMFDWGMETLRPLYGSVERKRVLDVSEYEQIGANLSSRWKTEFPDRNILGEAWQIIQRTPEEILTKGANARHLLRQAQIETSKTGKKVLTPDQYDQLMKDSDVLNEFLNLDDSALNEAVRQLWQFSGHIFSGGEKSLIKRYGLTPQWLNRNLREIGGGKVRAAIDENGVYNPIIDGYGFKDAKSMPSIWKEWEITNPLEMIVTMNAAIQRALVIPTIADDAVRKFGVRKGNYADDAAARADGLVAIKTVDNPARGRELVHFMDTENYYYPIEIAQELKTFSNFLGEIKHMQGKGTMEKFVLKFTAWTNFTKTMMTIFRPGNYIQNGEGSVWANFFGGVTSPMWYGRAAKAMGASGRKVKDLDLDALEKEMTRYEAMKGQEGFTIKSVNDPRKTDSMLVTVKGKAYPISYGDLEKLATRHGLRVPVAQNREMDLVPGMIAAKSIGEARNKAKQILLKGYNKAAYWAGKRSVDRDEFLRMTLFLKELGTNNWNSLEQGAEAAMKKVDRYHPQVQDLSTPIQKLRPFLMFMTWRSKMTAVVLGDILNRPGRMINSVRVTQAYNNSNQQSRSDTFGNLTPASVALPEEFKYNLDPIYTDPTTGEMTKFSIANPVTDLFGSTGLLTKINFNTYEPFPDQIVQVGTETLKEFTFQSFPWILKAAWSWPQNLTTSGQKISTGPYNTFQDAPAYLNDFMVGSGLNPLQQLAIATFPWLETGIAKSPDQQWAKASRVWLNFLIGAKITPLDTIPNRNRGMKELLDTLRGLKQMP